MSLPCRDPHENKIITEIALEAINTKWCREILVSDYEESVKKLSFIEKHFKEEKTFKSDKGIGKPIAETSFGAKLYKVDGIEAKELLSNIKSAFKDKALIFDFWATWCIPCLGDIPYSKKLHDELKNEPIEFIYLCTSSGSDLETWKTKITELKIGGTHLFVESSIESELMSLFSFTGFPSYAFFDINGKYKAGSIHRMRFLDKEKVKKLIKGK